VNPLSWISVVGFLFKQKATPEFPGGRGAPKDAK
jgi:hypothetical protein